MNLAELLTLKDKHDLVAMSELTNTRLGVLAAFFVRNDIQKTPVKSRSAGKENLSFVTKSPSYHKDRSKLTRASKPKLKAQPVFKPGYFTPSAILSPLCGAKALKRAMLKLGGKHVRYYHKGVLIKGYADIYLNRSSIKMFNYEEWVKENLVYTGKRKDVLSAKDIYSRIIQDHRTCGYAWANSAIKSVLRVKPLSLKGERVYRGLKWKGKNG